MRLFIAEKPGLGKVIAEALGSQVTKNGYIQCGANDVVTWCVGHLLQLAGPEAHNPVYATWRKEDLPLTLRPHKYVPIEKTEAQLNIVAQLLERATEVVHAGDPDDEGQLLVDEVLVYYGNTKPVKRLLLNDMNPNAARKALTNLRDNSEFHGLSLKALARSIGDQIYGFNMTRAYTLAAQEKGFRGVLSMGRVQTVILGLIVNRYIANRSHAAAFYYNLAGSFSFGVHVASARFVVPDTAPVNDKGRIVDEGYANGVANDCRQAVATVASAKVEEKTRQAPLPFSLLDLQIAVSKQHGIKAEKTLQLTQALRDKHKAITYNRSDCSYLTEEQFVEAPATLKNLAGLLTGFQKVFEAIDPGRKGRAFNDSKVSAHTAIIPTATRFDIAALTADESKVYQIIARRYLAQFLPQEQFLEATVVFSAAGHTFKTSAEKVTHPGWTVIDADFAADDDEGSADGEQEKEGAGSAPGSRFEVLAALEEHSSGRCTTVTVSKEKTSPPPLYTEVTLLKDLQRVSKYVDDPRIKQLLLDRDEGKAAGEKGGIGTPATRGAHLEKLQERGFYVVDKKKIVPTPLGIEFISILPPIATKPDMTALWHEQQRKIERGELTVDQFLDELDSFIAEQIANVDVGNIKAQPAIQIDACCPMCGGELKTTTKVVACAACSFRIWPELAGKALTAQQLQSLLTKGRTGVIKGFTGKNGKFDASLRLNAEGKALFVVAK